MTGAWGMAALAALLGAETPPAAGARYENARCGLSLLLPPGWTARELDKKDFGADTTCALGLRPADWAAQRRRAYCSAGAYAITVELHPGSLEEASWSLLVQREGEWRIDGRDGAQIPATPLRYAHGRALRGIADTGCSRGGRYAGLSQTDVAFVESGNQVAEFVADINLGQRSKSPFFAIARSLRLRPRPAD